MKILYISTVFPRPEQSSTIYTDLAEELKKNGHEILVVAADGDCKLDKTQILQERGMTVLRVKTGTMYDVGFIKKGITLLTLKYYLINSIKKYLSTENFDLILFESPPVTIIDVVKWAMKYFNCPSYLMLKDIFPQNGVDIGIIKSKSLMHKFFSRKEKELYSNASIIGCMSVANRQYILDHNTWLNPAKVELFPNTKKINEKVIRPTNYYMRRKYGVPENAVVAVYGGNMGRPQGLEFLMDIVKTYQETNDVFFLLVGRGTERLKISELIKSEGLSNVMMLDALPREDYEALVTECDIGLIFLNKNFTIPNFPSRVLSYFEYGLPVIAATDRNTDFGEMIENASAGYWLESGDITRFHSVMNNLVSNKELRKSMSDSGRRYLEEHFSIDVSVSILEGHFDKVKVRNKRRNM